MALRPAGNLLVVHLQVSLSSETLRDHVQRIRAPTAVRAMAQQKIEISTLKSNTHLLSTFLRQGCQINGLPFVDTKQYGMSARGGIYGSSPIRHLRWIATVTTIFS
jgi:hypothetical protein